MGTVGWFQGGKTAQVPTSGWGGKLPIGGCQRRELSRHLSRLDRPVIPHKVLLNSAQWLLR